MPILKKCTAPGCRTICKDGSSRCFKHKHKRRRSVESTERIGFYNTPRWRKLSLSLRQQNPVCELCKRELTSDVDHWLERSVDLEEEYFFEPSNLVCLCKTCHQSKTSKLMRLIKNEDYQRIYQYCITHHPRQSDVDYLHSWIKKRSKKAETSFEKILQSCI
ncbi:HNH endonuclease [Vibrio parahaemolyticus]|nr:HNH endonuclease [Vibrio parahaemolyticus]EHU0344302.1 HNH endonuclease [Vibrio parahaemolyticus]EHU0354336.1 HNH endonuclease [Vibrio parahaemolyticus]